MSIVIVSCMYIISLYHNMNSFVSVFTNRIMEGPVNSVAGPAYNCTDKVSNYNEHIQGDP